MIIPKLFSIYLNNFVIFLRTLEQQYPYKVLDLSYFFFPNSEFVTNLAIMTQLSHVICVIWFKSNVDG